MELKLKKIEVKSQKELRNWLKKNHKQKESVWLVTYKKKVPEYYIEYSKIVDEALCFGWIDSLPRALDEQRKMLRLSPRKPKSAWSKINRDKVQKLIWTGQMTQAGLDIIERAKSEGSWDILKSTDGNAIPKELSKEFKKYSSSLSNFKKFPPSSQRAILEWIAQAKTLETKHRRMTETALLAAKNIRAHHNLNSKRLSKKSFFILGKIDSDLMEIPGLGKTFLKDFERIKIRSQKDLIGRDPQQIFDKLVRANNKENHKTSKNYLYVIRMAVYYAEGGREEHKLKWSFWKSE